MELDCAHFQNDQLMQAGFTAMQREAGKCSFCRIAALEARCRRMQEALKLGWKVVASTGYDGACTCVTCTPKREFLRVAEALTASETP